MPSDTGVSRDLATILAGRGALTVGEAARACAAAARALRDVAGRAIVHGDVRPARLVVSERGEIKLVGFGENAAGTPGYLAPERASGVPATPASDLYALGCTLYQLVTGRAPDDAAGLAGAAPGAEPALDALVRRLVAADPAARPAHDEVVATLDRIAKDLSASMPRLEGPASRGGGRTAFLAATPRTASLTRAPAPEPPWLRPVKWAVALAIFAAAVLWLWYALP